MDLLEWLCDDPLAGLLRVARFCLTVLMMLLLYVSQVPFDIYIYIFVRLMIY